VSCGSCRFADGTVDASKNTGNIARQTLSFDGLPQPFVTGYEYDSLYRLVNAKETQNGTRTWEQGFTYDRYGNRLSHDKFIGASQISQTNLTHPTIDANTNRFTAGQGYAFDKNGNLVTDPADGGRSFVFNGDNKQKEVRGPSNELIGEYFYDGEGKRVKKHRYVGGVLTEVTVFVYSAGKLAAEYSTAPPEQNPTTKWTVTDQLGSPRVLVDSLGQVVSRRDFMPFGEEITPDGTHRKADLKYDFGDNIRQKFTGYQKDEETQLDFAEARMYQNKHGRFTAPDPLLASASAANPQTFNRYIYTGNNPVNITDPSGLTWCQSSDGSVAWNGTIGKACAKGTSSVDGQELKLVSGSGGRDSNRTRFGVGDTIRFNRDGTREVVRTAPETQPVAQGQSVAGATQTIAGGTAADAATSNESSTGGVTQLPTSSQGPTILPLCTDEFPCGSGTQSLPRIGGVIAPLKSVEGIARIFELCSLAPGIGSACAVGAAATRFGQGRFGEAGDNLLNVVPFLGIARKADKAADVAQRGTTVIGHLYNVSPNYVEVAKSLGANYLKPSPNWNWRMQGDFIKDVIRRGDNVFIGTPIRGGKSVLKRDIKQLIKAGYRPARQGSKWLIKAD